MRKKVEKAEEDAFPQDLKAAEAEKKSNSKKSDNTQFALITYFFVTLFLVMIGYIVYFNATRAGSIIKSPYNIRKDALADRITRGDITDRNGAVLANTVTDEAGVEKRNYPYKELFAQVVGFCDPSAGKSGLESLENFSLLTSNSFIAERVSNELKGRKNIGDTVVTTLDAHLQAAAASALDGHKGAALVMEADTGRILAMVSLPSFDPNFAAEDFEDLTADDSSSPLLNRATQGLYAPGSTFKIVTALAYMRENPGYRNYGYDCEGEITRDGVTIRCAGHVEHGFQNLKSSMANSCNCSFANIGLSLDPGFYKKTAESLLFNQDLPCVLDYSKSKFQIDGKATAADMMMTAIGQGGTMVSPYHLTLITDAVANNGILMKPYLVEKVTSHKGAQIRENMPEVFKRLMTPEESATVKEYLTAVVEEGTARVLSGRSYSVAGKTGTAEYGGGREHSWFTGFSDVDNPDLVITVVIEDYEKGVTPTAAETAGKILDIYYR